MAFIDIIYNIEDNVYTNQEEFIKSINEYGIDDLGKDDGIYSEEKIIVAYYKDLYRNKNKYLAKAIAEAIWPIIGSGDEKQWIKEVAKEYEDILKKKFWTLPILSK